MKSLRTLSALLMAACAAALTGAGRDLVRTATGVAGSEREAVNDALALALEQQYGGQLVTSTKRTLNSVEVSRDADGRAESVAELNAALDKYISRNANGKILGYEVESSAYDATTRKHTVTLSVRFPGPYVVGRNPHNLRKMAVATFRPTGMTFLRSGHAIGTTDWARALGQKLNEQLTQTRKFSMLDRDFDVEVSAEMARISASDAAPGEAAKLNRKLGADYLVVGTVAFSDVAAPTVNPFTGETRMPAPATFAEVSYRVLLAATGQLKWADTVRLDASAFAALDATQFVSASAEQAATEICASILSAILPFEVVGKTGSGLLVIGQGGKTVFVGERLTAFALGEAVRDSRTGEVIDRIEDEVGTVEIVRVQEKLSYAKVLSGDASRMGKGCRVRREFTAQEGAASALPASDPMVKPVEGGVFLPFGN